MRDGTSLNIHIPKLTLINKIIIMASAGTFVLQAILERSMGWSLPQIFGLSLQGLMHGHVYQLLTYFLPSSGLMQVIFESLVLWFFGSELEVRWGAKSYLIFLFCTLLGGAALYLGVVAAFLPHFQAMPLYGLQGFSFALLVAYAISNPDALLPFMLVFPIRARYFCLILIVMEIYSGLFSAGKSSFGHLGGMLGGYLYLMVRTISDRNRIQRARRGTLTSKLVRNTTGEGVHLKLVKEDDKNGKNDGNGPKYWQ